MHLILTKAHVIKQTSFIAYCRDLGLCHTLTTASWSSKGPAVCRRGQAYFQVLWEEKEVLANTLLWSYSRCHLPTTLPRVSIKLKGRRIKVQRTCQSPLREECFQHPAPNSEVSCCELQHRLRRAPGASSTPSLRCETQRHAVKASPVLGLVPSVPALSELEEQPQVHAHPSCREPTCTSTACSTPLELRSRERHPSAKHESSQPAVLELV